MNHFFKRDIIKISLWVVACLIGLSSPLLATHIVGGQIEARHISGKNYEVKLVFFFDVNNGDPKSKDTVVQVAAYKKANDQLIDFFDLKLRSDVPVPYSNPLCQRGNIKTNQLVYLDTVAFKDVKYNDSGGFYLVWERCCRNATVRNLASPYETGTVFYAELPPLTIAGFNASPTFRSIIGDYGCVKRLFKLDFSASDTDGDSLVYHLATPLAGGTTDSDPSLFPSPAPYRLVNWTTGYSQAQMIDGILPLAIDASRGELQVIATQPGLYAFAVVCEEYRNSVKIGEVRREFQLPMVLCPVKPGPHMSFAGKEITDRKDTIIYKSGTQICRNITVTDTVQETPLNFYVLYPNGINTSSASINPLGYLINDVTDTSAIAFCINGYLKGRELPYVYRLLVKDDACSTPNTDTLTWYVSVKDTLEKPKPVVVTPLPDSGYVKPNEPVEIIVEVKDPMITQTDTSCHAKVEVSVSGLALSSGAQVSVVDNQVTIKWIPDCKVSTDSIITFKVFTSDESCITPYRDSVQVSVKVKDRDEAQNKPIPNFISPNGDGINDDFAVGEYLQRTCRGGFERIDIFNRWGTLVFESADEQFKWKADNVNDGLYYFSIKYQSRILEGYFLVSR